MEKIVIFIGILIVFIVFLLWCCLVAANRADSYQHKLSDLERKYVRQTRELNTITLWYKAYQEAINTEEKESKH